MALFLRALSQTRNNLFCLDLYFYNKEVDNKPDDGEFNISIDGKINFLLLLGIIVGVLVSGFWNPHIEFNIYGVHLLLQNIAFHGCQT